jgi:hypothetical protein
MSDLVREGRTLVFVSHNMSAMETLCQRAVLLEDGRVADDGPARDVIRSYLHGVEAQLMAEDGRDGEVGSAGLAIVDVSLHDPTGRRVDDVPAGAAMTVRLHFRADRPIQRPIFEVGLSDGRIGPFALASMLVDGHVPDEISGEGYVDCTFEDLPLFPRLYEIWGGVRGGAGFGDLVDWQRLRLFRVAGEIEGGQGAVSHSLTNAPVRLPYRWQVASATNQED